MTHNPDLLVLLTLIIQTGQDMEQKTYFQFLSRHTKKLEM